MSLRLRLGWMHCHGVGGVITKMSTGWMHCTGVGSVIMLACFF